MEAPTYVINATWDEDAKVWVAVSDDVPGLVAEADDLPQLMNKLKVLIPELLEANGVLPKPEAHSSFLSSCLPTDGLC
jgi:predicted RNase H-like HicB family nuclease